MIKAKTLSLYNKLDEITSGNAEFSMAVAVGLNLIVVLSLALFKG